MNKRRVFKGSCVINKQFLILIVINLAYFYFLVKSGKEISILQFGNTLLFNMFFGMFLGLALNYFEFDDQTLVVKNCWLFWVRREFRIDSIDKISIDPVVRVGTGIQIVIGNKRHVFACDFISDKDLAILAKKLVERGVEVEINVYSIKDKFEDINK